MYAGKDSSLKRNVDIYQTARREPPGDLNLELKIILTYPETRICTGFLWSQNAKTCQTYVKMLLEYRDKCVGDR